MFPFFFNVDEALPLYTAASYIEFGSFFQRLDAIFLLIWMLEICCYLSLASQFAILSFKKIANLRISKPLAFVIPLLIFAVSLLPKTFADSRFLEDVIYKYIIIVVIFILGFLLLVLANLKRKVKEGLNLKK